LSVEEIQEMKEKRRMRRADTCQEINEERRHRRDMVTEEEHQHISDENM
jgi:hypothetical protein